MAITNPALLNFLKTQLDGYLSDLATLVALDSYSYDRDGVNRVNDWLAERLTRLGCSVRRSAHAEAGDDLWAELRGHGSRRILLLGHSDTVYPAGTAAQRPLYTGGDRIVGPGTCDMKAGLLSGLYALAALRHVEFGDFASLVFLSVSDEEVGNRHSPPLIRAESRKADAVLTLEAARANGDIVTARKGILEFSVEAHGRAAHAGVEPEKGRNAILALAQHALALDGLNDPDRGVSVNIGTIQGGTLPNVVPAQARMQVDVRAFTSEILTGVGEAVMEILAHTPVEGVEIRVHQELVSPPMPRTAAVVRLERLTRSLAGELGFDVQGASTGGASDAAFAASEGVPVLDGLGPVGGLDHSPDEYILHNSILPRTALLANLLVAVCRGWEDV